MVKFTNNEELNKFGFTAVSILDITREFLKIDICHGTSCFGGPRKQSGFWIYCYVGQNLAAEGSIFNNSEEYENLSAWIESKDEVSIINYCVEKCGVFKFAELAFEAGKRCGRRELQKQLRVSLGIDKII